MAYEFFILKLVERESVAGFRHVVVLLYVCYYSLAYLQLYVRSRCFLLVVFVERLEIVSYYGALWYHVSS